MWVTLTKKPYLCTNYKILITMKSVLEGRAALKAEIEKIAEVAG